MRFSRECFVDLEWMPKYLISQSLCKLFRA
jgi:hypothetical protein